MTNLTNTFDTRIALKHDIEENWNKLKSSTNNAGFIPLAGEIIIYSPDDTYSYSRMKIGDGSTNIFYLPFIDAGSISGSTVITELEFYETKNNFPLVGALNKLYVDISTYTLYIYRNNTYKKISNYNYTTSKESASTISKWNDGTLTTFNIQGGHFFITSGTKPQLEYENTLFVKNIIKEGGG